MLLGTQFTLSIDHINVSAPYWTVSSNVLKIMFNFPSFVIFEAWLEIQLWGRASKPLEKFLWRDIANNLLRMGVNHLKRAFRPSHAAPASAVWTKSWSDTPTCTKAVGRSGKVAQDHGCSGLWLANMWVPFLGAYLPLQPSGLLLHEEHAWQLYCGLLPSTQICL